MQGEPTGSATGRTALDALPVAAMNVAALGSMPAVAAAFPVVAVAVASIFRNWPEILRSLRASGSDA